MARPRVFVSSTFYDLKQLRAELERFIHSLGYDAVLNERGLIPYGKDEALEEYCYREIITVDIVVALVGGRFGASSQHAPYSISQQEIKTALENDKPVFVFVQRDVHAEYDTYKRNKDNNSIQYAAVTDRKVFLFLDELYALPNNNPIAPFDRSEDVTDYLREQWAGLFQRSLLDHTKKREANLVSRLTATTDTLNQLVQLLSEDKRGSDTAVKEILLTTHPMFDQLRRLTNTPYRIFFTNHTELSEWLRARNYAEVPQESLDDPDNFEEWVIGMPRVNPTKYLYLHIAYKVFDGDGKLKVYTPSEWDPSWVFSTTNEVGAITDDDIPF